MLIKDRKYLVYKHTSSSNKSYIGITSNSADDRLHEHNNAAKQGSTLIFHRAIIKYGLENFKTEILAFDLTCDEACAAEIYFIKFYNTLKPNGYNITSGGDGVRDYKHTEETKELLSRLTKEQWLKDGDSMRKMLQGAIIKAHTALIEKFKNMTEEEKILFKNKISISCKKYWSSKEGILKSKEIHKPITEETKHKIRATLHEYRYSDATHEQAIKELGAKRVLCVETNTIYESQAEAERLLNINNINQVLKGKRITAGGFHWKYTDEDNIYIRTKTNRNTVLAGKSISIAKLKKRYGINFIGFINTIDSMKFASAKDIENYYKITSSQVNKILKDGVAPLRLKNKINIEVLYE
ncbi:MAG: hypothetical protein PHX51_08295 [Clostridia bacterium]|nr:hypothetical protein [Clostridia bacterium]